MNCKVMDVRQKSSKFGGKFYYVFLKEEKTGKSYRSCVYPNYRNYAKWHDLISAFSKTGDYDWIVEGLRVKNGDLVDADCVGRIRKIAKQQDIFAAESELEDDILAELL